jgi:hypothetical protein
MLCDPIVDQWVIHWATDLLLFPKPASCLREPFGPQENVKDLGNTVSINPWCL